MLARIYHKKHGCINYRQYWSYSFAEKL